jgi:hypothetical protein
MKSFKKFLDEQMIQKDQSTLDPDFLEKKQKKDNTISGKIENKIEEVNTDLEQAEEIKQ